MLNLRNFGEDSFDRVIFDNSCHFREELNRIYNILLPIREMSELISYFTCDFNEDQNDSI